MTLLTLFTHIQLNILGRSKYINSIIQAEREERLREQMTDDSVFSMLWNDEDLEEGEAQGADIISEETERKYLTLSWWILHVGWKDVGERVRRGVEEVFEGDGVELVVGWKSMVSEMYAPAARRVDEPV